MTHPLTTAERLIVHEAGGNTALAGKMLAIHRNLPDAFSVDEMTAICRCIRYHQQIADISIGSIWREPIIELLKPLNA